MGAIRGRSDTHFEGEGIMDVATGFGMLAMGLIAILIGSLIIYKVLNMVARKEKEEKERKERNKIYGSN